MTMVQRTAVWKYLSFFKLYFMVKDDYLDLNVMIQPSSLPSLSKSSRLD